MFGFGKNKKSPASNGQTDGQTPAPFSGIKGSLISLEQRLMFDAAAAATASEVATEQVAQEQAEAAVSGEASHDATSGENGGGEDVVQALTNYMPAEKCVEVAFIDPTVPNYQDMLAGLDPNVEVIMLDGGQDGVQQMASALEGRTGIDAIHLISHGSSGELQLGTGTLNAESMSGEYRSELATIRESLSDHADVLVYGCSFAEGADGVDAVNLLAELTGADVAASSDATGHIDLGGDWEFEVQAGSIETDLVLTDTAQMNWAGVLGLETVADTFSEKSYGNNDGTGSWSTTWSEVDVGASDAKGGHIKVNSGELRIETQVAGASVSRGVDLSGARSATLSFDYNNDLDKGGSVEIRISTDGGASYRTLSEGMFSKTSHTGSGTLSFDISDHMSADTKIQFLVTGTGGGDRLFIDNVQVDYDVTDANTAPTDITLTGSTVAENASTGTVVGTAAGVDADAGDTKSYSLADTAGGRFAINASTGQITVADGSLLNAEASASHNVTVRVTDAGGQSYDKTFTIGVMNVNEGPTDIALSGSTVAENASTGTVVGTAAGVDPDASDTKTYSLTDTAGGRFAIDPTTGVLTVADGSLLNYEAAASHTVTVQVTDSGGQSYDETFTISLSNVNEASPEVTGGDSGEQTLIASLFQKNPTVSAAVPPLASSLSTEHDDGGSDLGLADELRTPAERNSQPATVDILDSGRNHLNLLRGGDGNQVGGEARRESTSTSSDQQDATAGNLDPGTGVRPEAGEIPWSPTEAMEPLPDESGDLAMPMLAGLVGAAFQGSLKRKEKLTTMHGNISAGEQQAANEQTSQESSSDDKEAPPRAA